MNRLVTVVTGVTVALSAAVSSQASTDIDDIVQALTESPVYVAEGTEGTASDTVTTLLGQLHDGDNIAIVLLPSDAAATPEDISAIADQIGDGLGDDSIVAVAVGDSYGVDADALPSGVIDDLMHRADTVSQNPVDTLGTFVRNVHQWVLAHPQPIEETPAQAGDPSFLWLWIAGGAVLGAIIGIVIRLRLRRRRQTAPLDKGVPGEIRELLDRISEMAEDVGDSRIVSTLATARVDIGELFKRLRKRQANTIQQITALYRGNLRIVLDVVDRYVDIQNNPRYYKNPDQWLGNGKAAISSYSESVVQNIQEIEQGSLTNFTVDTKILSATKKEEPVYSFR